MGEIDAIIMWWTFVFSYHITGSLLEKDLSKIDLSGSLNSSFFENNVSTFYGFNLIIRFLFLWHSLFHFQYQPVGPKSLQETRWFFPAAIKDRCLHLLIQFPWISIYYMSYFVCSYITLCLIREFNHINVIFSAFKRYLIF